MRDTFKYQTAVNVSELTSYLAALIEGLESGNLNFQGNERFFPAHPLGLFDFGVKARARNGRAKISLEIAWAEDEATMPLLASFLETSGDKK